MPGTASWDNGQGAGVEESTGEEFAERLSELKRRSGLSYSLLAKRLHLSTSTLHRYCSGAAIPVEYAPVERLARVCGATPEELVGLHRLWVLADAARGRERGRGAARQQAAPTTVAAPLVEAQPSEQESAAGSGPSSDIGPGKRSELQAAPAEGQPWWRRSIPARPMAVTGLAVALLATLTLLGEQSWQDSSSAVEAAPESPAAKEVPPDDEPGASSDPPQEPQGPSALPVPAESSPPPAPPEESPAGEPESPGQVPDAVSQPPLDWTVRSHVWRHNCSHRYLVDRKPEDVPSAPVVQDSETWAGALEAVHGGLTVVETTLRSADGTPVVVEELYVRVDGRAEPLPGNLYSTGRSCGGALVHASFDVDLDAPSPLPVPSDGYDPREEKPVSPPRLPYQVTEDDPLSLRVEAETEQCDCTWTLEVEWSSGTERGMLVIDDEGQPFRTSAPRGDADAYLPHLDSWMPDPS